MSFGWRNQLAVGAVGEARVVDWLEANGWEVDDLTKHCDYQRRDIDFLLRCNGVEQTAEVKTDTHAPRNLFIELQVSGKPGYIWKTRAEVLLYCFPERDLLYWIDLPRLQHWIYQRGSRFDLKVVTSRSGGRTWTAEGIAVPIRTLLEEGVAVEHEL